MRSLIDFVHGAHYAATILVFGAVGFLHAVARPALVASSGLPDSEARRIFAFALRLASWGLAGSVLTGALWLCGEAITVSGLPPPQAPRPSLLLPVLRPTAFGRLW